MCKFQKITIVVSLFIVMISFQNCKNFESTGLESISSNVTENFNNEEDELHEGSSLTDNQEVSPAVNIDMIQPGNGPELDSNEGNSCEKVGDSFAIAQGEDIVAKSVESGLVVTVKSNSTEDIKAAIEQVIANKGGALYFPRGVYTLKRIGSTSRTEMYFDKLDYLKIYGDGDDSVIQVTNSPSIKGSLLKSIQIHNVKKFEVANLKLVGGKEFNVNPDIPETGENKYILANRSKLKELFWDFIRKESQNLLHIRDSVESGYIHGVTFRKAGGDGINMSNVTNVVIEKNDFNELGRNGITLGGTRGKDRSKNVRIDSNKFGSDIDTQVIDMELHGAGKHNFNPLYLNENIQVINNIMEKQVPVDRIDKDQFAIAISEVNIASFESNKMQHRVTLINATNVSIKNNDEISLLVAFRKGKMNIENNIFNLVNNDTRNKQVGIQFLQRENLFPEKIRMSKNTITSNDIDMPMHFFDTEEVILENNKINFSNNSTSLDFLLRTTDTLIYEKGNTYLNNQDNGIAERNGHELMVKKKGSHDCL